MLVLSSHDVYLVQCHHDAIFACRRGNKSCLIVETEGTQGKR